MLNNDAKIDGRRHRVWQLVDSMDIPPTGRGSGMYWTRVQRTWNRHHREDRFETPDGPRMWFNRLQDKLKALGLDGPRGA
jgi:hypothetical protein